MPTPSVACRVLLIDDQPINDTLMTSMLEGEADIVTAYVQDPAQALERAAAFGPSVILLDLRMPTIDGLDVIRAFKATPGLSDVPIIMLSSNDSPHAKAEGFAGGAMDYLVKWPDRIELAARIRAHSRACHAARERDQAVRALERSQADLLARTHELAQAQASLHDAQKMEAIGQLTGGIAHDFNNVLQLINGHLQLLRIAQRADDKTMRRLDAASEGVRRGAELAARLLAFARRQPLRPVTARADVLVHGMAHALRAALDGRALAIHAGAGQALVALDQVEFEKTMLQLARNAAEASAPDGRLDIAIDSVEEDGLRQVRIRLCDSGEGMSEETRRRAFEPFFSTRPGRRAGIGLSLAFAFVKQSGGHIDLSAGAGGGTCVGLSFPAAEGPAARTVLVVEDEAAVRQASVEVLRKSGWCVLEAADGDSALALIRARLPIDLLFTDVLMPGAANGADLARAAAEHLPAARVLFASGYPGEDWQAGAPLLAKPYRLDEMSRMVARLMDVER